MKNISQWKLITTLFLILSCGLFSALGYCQDNSENPALGKIEKLLADTTLWKDAASMDKTKDEIRTAVETAVKNSDNIPRFMDILIEMAMKYRITYIPMISLGLSDTVKNDTGLRAEYEKKLLEVVRKNRENSIVTGAFDTIGVMKGFYKTPPPPEEQKIFLDLLQDPKTYPLIRATAAMFLSNTKDTAIRDQVKNISEKLLRIYNEFMEKSAQEKETIGEVEWPFPLYGDSRTIGRLMITLKNLKKL